MAGLGSSSLENEKKAIGMFLTQKTENNAKETETYNIQKGVRLSERQDKNLADLKIALGTDLDAEAIRWALDEVFRTRGDEIREIAEKKKGMSLS